MDPNWSFSHIKGSIKWHLFCLSSFEPFSIPIWYSIASRRRHHTTHSYIIAIIEKSFQLPCIIVLFQCMALLLYVQIFFLLEVDNVWWHVAKRNREFIGWIYHGWCVYILFSILSDLGFITFYVMLLLLLLYCQGF